LNRKGFDLSLVFPILVLSAISLSLLFQSAITGFAPVSLNFSNAPNVSDCSSISQTTFLSSDVLMSSNVCFNFSSNNLVFDCNGHKIFGGLDNSIAFLLSNNYNITLQNCVINLTGSSSVGIELVNNSINNLITNNTITKDNGSSFGLFIDNSSLYNHIETLNSVNNESIHYYFNTNLNSAAITYLDLIVVNSSNLGKLTVVNCSNSYFELSNFLNNPYGIYLVDNFNITIDNNNIFNNSVLNAYSNDNSVLNLNWWGSNNNSLFKVSANINYTPWLWEESPTSKNSNTDFDGDGFRLVDGDCRDNDALVWPVNCSQPPFYNGLLTYINFSEDTNLSVNLSTFFHNPLNEVLNYSYSRSNSSISVNISNGLIKISPALNYNGVSTLNITASNQNGNDSANNIIVNVTSVFDELVIVGGNPTDWVKDQPVYFSFNIVSNVENSSINNCTLVVNDTLFSSRNIGSSNPSPTSRRIPPPPSPFAIGSNYWYINCTYDSWRTATTGYNYTVYKYEKYILTNQTIYNSQINYSFSLIDGTGRGTIGYYKTHSAPQITTSSYNTSSTDNISIMFDVSNDRAYITKNNNFSGYRYLTINITLSSGETIQSSNISLHFLESDYVTDPQINFVNNNPNSSIIYTDSSKVLLDKATVTCPGAYNMFESDQTCVADAYYNGSWNNFGNCSCDPVYDKDSFSFTDAKLNDIWLVKSDSDGNKYVMKSNRVGFSNNNVFTNISNTVFDCNNFYITGNFNNNFFRINNSRNITFRNCNISDFKLSFNITDSDNIIIKNSDIYSNISIENSNVSFFNNNFYTDGLDSDGNYCPDGKSNFYGDNVTAINSSCVLSKPFKRFIEWNTSGLDFRDVQLRCKVVISQGDSSYVVYPNNLSIDIPLRFVGNATLVSWNQDTSAILNLTPLFNDSDPLSFNFTSISDISASVNGGLITFTPGTGYYGVKNITIKARDSDYEISKVFTLDVLKVVTTSSGTTYSGSSSSGGIKSSITAAPSLAVSTAPVVDSKQSVPSVSDSVKSSENSAPSSAESVSVSRSPSVVVSSSRVSSSVSAEVKKIDFNPYAGTKVENSLSKEKTEVLAKKIFGKVKISSRNDVSYEFVSGKERTVQSKVLRSEQSVPLNNVVVRETFPKDVLKKASDLESDDNYAVIEDDPVVEFIIPILNPGEEITIQYSLPSRVSLEKIAEIESDVSAAELSKEEMDKEVSKTLERSEETSKFTNIEKRVVEENGKTKIILNIEPGKKLYNFTVYEEIPKCLAQRINEILATNQNFTIIEDDPLIAWHFAELDSNVDLFYEVGKLTDFDCADSSATLALAEEIAGEYLETDFQKYAKLMIPILLVPLVAWLFIFLGKFGEEFKETSKWVNRAYIYLRRQEKKGFHREAIRNALLAAKWPLEYVQHAFEFERRHILHQIITKLEVGVEELVLLILVAIKFLDIFGFFPTDAGYIEKIISWTCMAYLLYKASLSDIFFGNKSIKLDIAIIFAYFMLLFKDLIEVARLSIDSAYFLKPLYRFLLKNYQAYEVSTFFIGAILLLIIAIYVALKLEIKGPSIMHILHEDGTPTRSVSKTFVRFLSSYLILCGFFIIVFNLIMEWLTIAIDTPLVLIVVFAYIFILLKHHEKFHVDSFLFKVGDITDSFYEEFVKFFQHKSLILFAISGMLILHSMTEIGAFTFPALTGTDNEMYGESLDSGAHRVIFNMIPTTLSFFGKEVKEPSLFAESVENESFTRSIEIWFLYFLNIFALISLLFIPGLLWYRIFKRGTYAPNKLLVALFFASLAAFAVNPVFHLESLKDKTIVGVDIQTSVLNFDQIFSAFALAVIIFFLIFYLYDEIREYLITGSILVSVAFFAKYIFLFFNSIVTYYIQYISILLKENNIAAAVQFIVFMIILLVFYVFGLFTFLFELWSRKFFFNHKHHLERAIMRPWEDEAEHKKNVLQEMKELYGKEKEWMHKELHRFFSKDRHLENKYFYNHK